MIFNFKNSIAQFPNSLLSPIETKQLLEKIHFNLNELEDSNNNFYKQDLKYYDSNKKYILNHLDSSTNVVLVYYLKEENKVVNPNQLDTVLKYFTIHDDFEMLIYKPGHYLKNKNNSYHIISRTYIEDRIVSYLYSDTLELIPEEVVYFIDNYNYNDNATLFFVFLSGYFIVEDNVLYKIIGREKIKASEYYRGDEFKKLLTIINPIERSTKCECNINDLYYSNELILIKAGLDSVFKNSVK